MGRTTQFLKPDDADETDAAARQPDYEPKDYEPEDCVFAPVDPQRMESAEAFAETHPPLAPEGDPYGEVDRDEPEEVVFSPGEAADIREEILATRRKLDDLLRQAPAAPTPPPVHPPSAQPQPPQPQAHRPVSAPATLPVGSGPARTTRIGREIAATQQKLEQDVHAVREQMSGGLGRAAGAVGAAGAAGAAAARRFARGPRPSRITGPGPLAGQAPEQESSMSMHEIARKGRWPLLLAGVGLVALVVGRLLGRRSARRKYRHETPEMVAPRPVLRPVSPRQPEQPRPAHRAKGAPVTASLGMAVGGAALLAGAVYLFGRSETGRQLNELIGDLVQVGEDIRTLRS